MLPEVKAGNAHVIFATSACCTPPQGTAAACPLLSVDSWGAPTFSEGGRQHESGSIWPDAIRGTSHEEETHSCSQGRLEVLSFSGNDARGT